MSARERAHPWWVDPLVPYPGTGVDVRPEPLCLNCNDGITGHYILRGWGDWYSPMMCKRPRGRKVLDCMWRQ